MQAVFCVVKARLRFDAVSITEYFCHMTSSTKEAFEASQREIQRMREYGKQIEDKAISDGQREKYKKKLAEFKKYLQDFQTVEEVDEDGTLVYRIAHPYKKFVSGKDKYSHGIKAKLLRKRPDIVEQFLLQLKARKRRGGGGGSDAAPVPEEEQERRKGVPMLKLYRAAISHLFSSQDVEPSNLYNNHMKHFFRGLGNDAASKGNRRKAKQSGKEGMSFPLYLDIMQKYGEVGKCMFVCFLGMTWNLICRGKQTAHIYLSQLRVDNDAITVVYESTKTDADGHTVSCTEPRHLYANPYNWKCCIFTWLGIYFLTNPNVHCDNVEADGDCLLFPGKDKKGDPNQKVTFAQALKRDKSKGCLGQVFTRHGVNPKDSGVHSVRKGAATAVASASTAGPSMPAICNRCNWSIGTVLDRYLGL